MKKNRMSILNHLKMRDKRFLGYILAIIVCMMGSSFSASAQFKEEAFTQNYNPADSTAQSDAR